MVPFNKSSQIDDTSETLLNLSQSSCEEDSTRIGHGTSGCVRDPASAVMAAMTESRVLSGTGTSLNDQPLEAVAVDPSFLPITGQGSCEEASVPILSRGESEGAAKAEEGTIRTTSTEGACSVCKDKADGNFFGATVCLPCKSFFIRCTKDGDPTIVKQCHGNCNVTKQLRNRCQFCRFQRCLAVGMTRKEKPEVVLAEEGQTLCHVCADLANGVHFGVMTCEGCKKFFRRGLKEHESYVCRFSKDCALNPRNRNNCRYCRYQKCLAAGMSRDAIKMGRPRKIFHHSASEAPENPVGFTSTDMPDDATSYSGTGQTASFPVPSETTSQRPQEDFKLFQSSTNPDMVSASSEQQQTWTSRSVELLKDSDLSAPSFPSSVSINDPAGQSTLGSLKTPLLSEDQTGEPGPIASSRGKIDSPVNDTTNSASLFSLPASTPTMSTTTPELPVQPFTADPSLSGIVTSPPSGTGNNFWTSSSSVGAQSGPMMNQPFSETKDPPAPSAAASFADIASTQQQVDPGRSQMRNPEMCLASEPHQPRRQPVRHEQQLFSSGPRATSIASTPVAHTTATATDSLPSAGLAFSSPGTFVQAPALVSSTASCSGTCRRPDCPSYCGKVRAFAELQDNDWSFHGSCLQKASTLTQPTNRESVTFCQYQEGVVGVNLNNSNQTANSSSVEAGLQRRSEADAMRPEHFDHNAEGARAVKIPRRDEDLALIDSFSMRSQYRQEFNTAKTVSMGMLDSNRSQNETSRSREKEINGRRNPRDNYPDVTLQGLPGHQRSGPESLQSHHSNLGIVQAHGIKQMVMQSWASLLRAEESQGQPGDTWSQSEVLPALLHSAQGGQTEQLSQLSHHQDYAGSLRDSEGQTDPNFLPLPNKGQQRPESLQSHHSNPGIVQAHGIKQMAMQPWASLRAEESQGQPGDTWSQSEVLPALLHSAQGGQTEQLSQLSHHQDYAGSLRDSEGQTNPDFLPLPNKGQQRPESLQSHHSNPGIVQAHGIKQMAMQPWASLRAEESQGQPGDTWSQSEVLPALLHSAQGGQTEQLSQLSHHQDYAGSLRDSEGQTNPDFLPQPNKGQQRQGDQQPADDNPQQSSTAGASRKDWRNNDVFEPYLNWDEMFQINQVFVSVSTVMETAEEDENNPWNIPSWCRGTPSGEISALEEEIQRDYHVSPGQMTDYWQNLTSKCGCVPTGGEMPDKYRHILASLLKIYTELLDAIDNAKYESVETGGTEWPNDAKVKTYWKAVQRRILRGTQCCIKCAYQVPGMEQIHPNDKNLLVRRDVLFPLGLLSASTVFFDAEKKDFKHFFNWTFHSEHPMAMFRQRLLSVGRKIFAQQMDLNEIALIFALNVICLEKGDFVDQDSSERARQDILMTLTTYISCVRRMNPKQRMQNLFRLMPRMRMMGVWHGNLMKNMKFDTSLTKINIDNIQLDDA